MLWSRVVVFKVFLRVKGHFHYAASCRRSFQCVKYYGNIISVTRLAHIVECLYLYWTSTPHCDASEKALFVGLYLESFPPFPIRIQYNIYWRIYVMQSCYRCVEDYYAFLVFCTTVTVGRSPDWARWRARIEHDLQYVLRAS